MALGVGQFTHSPFIEAVGGDKSSRRSFRPTGTPDGLCPGRTERL
jgi:hypothetical protein